MTEFLKFTHFIYRVLLQRISAILTEPARDTVKEYDAMKKLVVPKSQGKASAVFQPAAAPHIFFFK